MSDELPRCPVCRAAMRGAHDCPRCEADLAPLYAISARAHMLRSEAVDAIHRRDPAACARRANEAQKVHATESGARLAWLCTLLARLR